ncbi:MAG TPA: PilZ domain-containing protein [Spirochaetia bacterium]|nr:PilZ domain-containing protein [Spirochaetia bacterium]
MKELPASDLGKKVFFIYPHSVIQKKLISNIIEHEYEVYLLEDHRKALRVLEVYNDSILFVNIDKGLREKEWEKYVRGIMSSEATKNARIGIVTYDENKALAEKYLMELMVPCGFIRLKIGVEESTRIILKTLEANEAKGRRRFVRAVCRGSNRATFNIKIRNKIITGLIIDISSAGMACSFDGEINLKVGTPFNDLQLRLKGSLCRLSGRVAGFIEADTQHYVIMFDENLDQHTRAKIRSFIFSVLHEEINKI